MEIPLELQYIDTKEQDLLRSVPQEYMESEYPPELTKYDKISKRKQELFKLMNEIIYNPDEYTTITEPYIIIEIRQKVVSLIDDIKNGRNVEESTIKKDKLLNILPNVTSDEIKYYFLKSFILNKHKIKSGYLQILDNSPFKIETTNMTNMTNMIQEHIINVYRKFNEIGQYSEFDPDEIYNISKEIKQKISELNI